MKIYSKNLEKIKMLTLPDFIRLVGWNGKLPFYGVFSVVHQNFAIVDSFNRRNKYMKNRIKGQQVTSFKCHQLIRMCILAKIETKYTILPSREKILDYLHRRKFGTLKMLSSLEDNYLIYFYKWFILSKKELCCMLINFLMMNNLVRY
jgi:hypothetical protein